MEAPRRNLPEPEERSMLEGALHLLGILRRYRWFIVLFTLVVGLGILALLIVSLRLPPERSPLPNVYQASAVILLEPESSEISDLLAAISPTQVNGRTRTGTGSVYPQIAMRVLTSRSFLDTLAEEFRLIERLNLTEKSAIRARQYILGHSELNYNRTTGELTIAFRDTDPVFSRDLVNRMVELLDEWFSLRSGTRKLRMKNLLEEKLSEVSLGISQLENKIKDFQQKYGVLNVTELSAAQSGILGNLRSQLVLTELEIQNHSRFSNIEDPVLTRLKTERDNALKMINQIESGGGNYGALAPGQKDLPELSLEFTKLNAELNIQRRIYETLSEQYEVAKLSLESTPVFQILELAEVPELKTGPQRSQIAAVGVAAAFALSILISLLHHSIRKIRSDPEKMKILRGETL